MNRSMPLSRSSRVCAADGMTRMRAVPFGTVGNTMAVANTPRSKSFALKFFASPASPMMTGVIGVSLLPMSKPASPRLGDFS